MRILRGHTIEIKPQFAGDAFFKDEARVPAWASGLVHALPTTAAATRSSRPDAHTKFVRHDPDEDIDIFSSPKRLPEAGTVETHTTNLTRDFRLQISASDVVDFFEDPLITWLERRRLDKIWRDEDVPELAVNDFIQLLWRKGLEHEARVLEKLPIDLGLETSDVTMIGKRDTFVEAYQETIRAMQLGDAIIYQGAVARGALTGSPDFLVKVQNPQGVKTKIGDQEFDFHYVPYEAKLPSRALPKHAIQLCQYAYMLEGMQGYLPPEIFIEAGQGKGFKLKTADYYELSMHYRRGLLQQQAEYSRDTTVPQPHRLPHSRWEGYMDHYLESRDSVRILSAMTETQATNLNDAGIKTIADLAATDLPRVPHMARQVFARYKRQAQLIVAARTTDEFQSQIIDDLENTNRGLQTLPYPSRSRNDIFLVMQDSNFIPGDLSYSFGYTSFDPNSSTENPSRSQLITRWSEDHTDEEKHFKNLMRNIRSKYRKDRTVHVYYYGKHTLKKLQKLAHKFGAHEADLDELIKNNVFVDIQSVTRESVATSSDSYELADLAPLVGVELKENQICRAEEAMVLASAYYDHEDEEIRSTAKEALERKQKVDVALLFRLYNFLQGQKVERGATYHRPQHNVGPRPYDAGFFDRPRKTTVKNKNTPNLVTSILRNYSNDIEAYKRGEDNARGRMALDVINALLYHVREARAWHARFFARAAQTSEELFEDTSALSGLALTEEPPFQAPGSKSMVYTYEFDPEQEHRVQTDVTCRVVKNPSVSVGIHAIDYDRGLIQIKITEKMLEKLGGQIPNTMDLLPYDFVSPQIIHDQLYELASGVNKITDPRINPLARDILMRSRAKIKEWLPDQQTDEHGYRIGSLIKGDSYERDATGEYEFVNLVLKMESGILLAQGGGGSGKTTMAARAIVALIKKGEKPVITGNSHRSINNLLFEVYSLLKEEGLEVKGIKVDDGGEHRDDRLKHFAGLDFSRDAAKIAANKGDYQLFAGTSWMLAQPEFRRTFSHIFIDEAGVFSWANALGNSHTSTRMIVFGDQRQNRQPSKADGHPDYSGESILDNFLSQFGDDVAVIPPEFGVHFYKSFRLPEQTADFVSEEFYDGALQSAKGNNQQVLTWRRSSSQRMVIGNQEVVMAPSGMMSVSIPHQGNLRRSYEEALAVQALCQLALRADLKSQDADEEEPGTRLNWGDIFVLAPFNAQAELLRRVLPEAAQVGTIDSYQGRENKVVIVSLAASDIERSSHGRRFVTDPRRLNSALTREQVLVAVVGSPHLLNDRPQTLAEMRDLNRLAIMFQQIPSLQ